MNAWWLKNPSEIKWWMPRVHSSLRCGQQLLDALERARLPLPRPTYLVGEPQLLVPIDPLDLVDERFDPVERRSRAGLARRGRFAQQLGAARQAPQHRARALPGAGRASRSPAPAPRASGRRAGRRRACPAAAGMPRAGSPSPAAAATSERLIESTACEVMIARSSNSPGLAETPAVVAQHRAARRSRRIAGSTR